MNDWQPIETAPRDGTCILVYTHHGDVELSHWYQLWHDEYKLLPNGLYRKNRILSSEGWDSNEPKFWMPLPPPPAATVS